MISSIYIKPDHYVPVFQGVLAAKKTESFKDSDTIQFITDNMLHAKTPKELKEAIKVFRNKFDAVYGLGADKWQNPKYHQYTVTDHMLKCMEQTVNLLNGNHNELDTLITPAQKNVMLGAFKQEIAGINKGALLVLAMAFHDLDKFFMSKPFINEDGECPKVDLGNHCSYFHNVIDKAQIYWTFEFEPDKAIELFKQTTKGMNLPEPAVKYASDVLLNHDNPLREVIWQVENGKTNITQLFDEMKQKTPMPLKELALIYLADQSSKGCDGWLDHLEKVSPWRAMFKSLVAERPLKELDILLKNKEKP